MMASVRLVPKMEKYLARHGITPSGAENPRPIKIVIPAYAESKNILFVLDDLSKQDGGESCQVIVVVNNPEGDGSPAFRDNQKTLSLLRRSGLSALSLRVEDRSSPGRAFPKKIAGVGVARKWGLDIALADLCSLGGRGLLVNLDADCRVPDNYLETLKGWERSRKHGAAVINYLHPLPEEPAHREAIALYEIRLRYTQRALAATGTLNAFESMGSALVCRPGAYVLAGGMNTRRATEDFYFLMKLIECTSVDRITQTAVIPSARVSDRVHLGTGYGVGRLLKDARSFALESPESYRMIGSALDILLSGFGKSVDETLERLERRATPLFTFLVEKSLERNLAAALRGTRTKENYVRRMHKWFNGLRIRQAVRYLGEKHFSDRPWAMAVKDLTGIDEGGDAVRTLMEMRRKML